MAAQLDRLESQLAYWAASKPVDKETTEQWIEATKKRNAFDAFKDERKEQIRQAVAEGTVVDPDDPEPGTKKRKRPSNKSKGSVAKKAKDTFVLPPIPARNTRRSGGTKKGAGKLFVAVYDNAAALGSVFCQLPKFEQQYALLFTAEGLQIEFIDVTRTTLVRLSVPCKAWKRYDQPLAGAVSIVVSAEAMKRFCTLCNASYSLTFMYDECGSADEPLHLMLYPRNGDPNDGQQIIMKVPPIDMEEETVSPVGTYQYEVTVPCAEFLSTIRQLGKHATTISLRLSSTKFDMVSIGENDMSILQYNMNRVADKDEMGAKTCTIERLPDADRSVNMQAFLDCQFSPVLIECVASFGTHSSCPRCAIRFGVDETGSIRPAHVRFPFRDGESGHFVVDVWLAPKND